MQNRKQLEEDISLIGSLRGLAQAYEEISVTKMQRVRGKVLSSREFMDELSDVFSDVKSSYKNEITKLMEQKKKNSVSFSTLQKNGKSIAILLSSNSKLYGDIGKKVFRFFLENVKQVNPDIYIIGKVGREFYEALEDKKEYRYIDFPQDDNIRESLGEVLRVLEGYETVNVFYGKFLNVLDQNPVVANVSGTQGLYSNEESEKKVKFFFEPSLEHVLSIFENQIFASLFKQTLHESELSHVASRIRQMENALENIQESQVKLNKLKRRSFKREGNAKQLQRLSGLTLWR